MSTHHTVRRRRKQQEVGREGRELFRMGGWIWTFLKSHKNHLWPRLSPKIKEVTLDKLIRRRFLFVLFLQFNKHA